MSRHMDPIKAVSHVLLIWGCFHISTAQNLNDSTYRLPKTVIPNMYHLILTILPDQDNFTGSVRIEFDVIHEKSPINDIYINLDEKYILIESVLPIYARRAFPCFDEPSFKANFSLEATYPSEYTILSNNVEGRESNTTDGMKTTQFETTEKISMYLVSILLSKFQATSTLRRDLHFKVYTKNDGTNFTRVITGYHNKILDQLDDYIEVPFLNLEEQSYHAAIPDSHSGSGGDFGLFTYRETDILDEGEDTPSIVTQNIVVNIATKLARGWYGGSISTAWWSDVWTNDALAAYLGYLIADEALQTCVSDNLHLILSGGDGRKRQAVISVVNTDFDIYNQFVVDVIQKTLRDDAMPTALPLSSNEEDIMLEDDILNKLTEDSVQKRYTLPAVDININIFDKLNFLGVSVLHMFNFMLGGKEEFRKILKAHFRKRRDFVSNTYRFLKDLGSIKSTLRPILENWAYTPGYPIVSVAIEKSTNTTDVVELSQKRFVYPMENATHEENGWLIPLTSCISTNQKYDMLIEEYYDPENDNLFFYGNGSWILFNLQGRFLYRVNYDETLWRRLISYLKDDDLRAGIHVLNRAQMVDDIFNIARTGDVSYGLAFELAEFLINETEYYPWKSALTAFSYVLGKLENDDAEANLRSYILNMLRFIEEFPTYPFNGNHVDVLKYVMILEWSCKLDHADCVLDAQIKFTNYKDGLERIEDHNLRRNIFCTALRHSDDVLEDWEFLWNIYTTSTLPHEQSDILYALGCTDNKNLLECENVLLAYFSENAKNYKSSTLWAQYSMVKSCLIIYDNIDISKFPKLFFAKILTKSEIDRFLSSADDKEFLMIKVGLILGIAGACRTDELVNLTVDDIEDCRRSSATLLADAGVDITTIKRHAGWKSTTVAEGYVENSIENKTKIANQVLVWWYLLKLINSDIKKQDVAVIFKSVFNSDSLGLQAAIDFLGNRFEDIISLYPEINILSEMIYAMAEKIFKDEDFEWLKNLVAHEILDNHARVRSKAIALAAVNNFWAKNYRNEIIDIFTTT
ncbi:hypothetical protein NQ317_005279 [Molorchus minor]|uniref:Aminopeptidase n=1 Tax=Molorchus minor TaxID=1323400 RepID=A0ABQ9JYL5_9CUCU|nr:hypothetical protein NQ317_005279 [Molorchus minor]